MSYLIWISHSLLHCFIFAVKFLIFYKLFTYNFGICSLFSAFLILILTHFVCFHSPHLLTVAYILSCSSFFLVFADVIFLWGNLSSTAIVNGTPAGCKKYGINHWDQLFTVQMLVNIDRITSLCEKLISVTQLPVLIQVVDRPNTTPIGQDRTLWPSKLCSNEFVFQRSPFSVWKQGRVFIVLS